MRFGRSRKTFYRTVGLCVLAAVLYGVVHDQITARICVEYFTVAHPPLIRSESPTVLGLFWGIRATWWVGLLLGVVLATCSEAGSRPAIAPHEHRKPLLALLGVMAFCALAAGVAGYHVGIGRLHTELWILEGVPPERMQRFSADAWAHLASYGSGIAGGLVLAVRALRRRARTPSASTPSPFSQAAPSSGNP